MIIRARLSLPVIGLNSMRNTWRNLNIHRRKWRRPQQYIAGTRVPVMEHLEARRMLTGIESTASSILSMQMTGDVFPEFEGAFRMLNNPGSNLTLIIPYFGHYAALGLLDHQQATLGVDHLEVVQKWLEWNASPVEETVLTGLTEQELDALPAVEREQLVAEELAKFDPAITNRRLFLDHHNDSDASKAPTPQGLDSVDSYAAMYLHVVERFRTQGGIVSPAMQAAAEEALAAIERLIMPDGLTKVKISPFKNGNIDVRFLLDNLEVNQALQKAAPLFASWGDTVSSERCLELLEDNSRGLSRFDLPDVPFSSYAIDRWHEGFYFGDDNISEAFTEYDPNDAEKSGGQGVPNLAYIAWHNPSNAAEAFDEVVDRVIPDVEDIPVATAGIEWWYQAAVRTGDQQIVDDYGNTLEDAASQWTAEDQALSRHGIALSALVTRATGNEIRFPLVEIDSLIADYGDAPASYQTRINDDGPRHAIGNANGGAPAMLGNTIELDSDAKRSVFNDLYNGQGDDNDHNAINPRPGDIDDEDGVNLPAQILVDQSYTFDATVSTEGFLSYWIDFNRNGVFENDTEKHFTSVSSGSNTLNFTTPTCAQAGITYARFRFSTVADDIQNPTGLAADGEVEDYRLVIQTNPGVIDRYTFYDNSAYDMPADSEAGNDAAIATDKAPFLPLSCAATSSNYTSSVKGITGIMIDMKQMPSNITLSPATDFEFRVGNDNDTSNWTLLSGQDLPEVRPVRYDHGFRNSIATDRVTLIWPPDTIKNQWLEVTMKATPNTGLAEADVFYFGNAPGESSGLHDGSTAVNASDFAEMRSSSASFLTFRAVENRFDHNRDGLVDGADLLIVRENSSLLKSQLQLINPSSSFSSLESSSEASPTEISNLEQERAPSTIDPKYTLSEPRVPQRIKVTEQPPFANQQLNVVTVENAHFEQLLPRNNEQRDSLFAELAEPPNERNGLLLQQWLAELEQSPFDPV